MKGSVLAMAVLLAIMIVSVVPFGVIWALNTLFGLTIEFTIYTWLAALLLSAVASGGGK